MVDPLILMPLFLLAFVIVWITVMRMIAAQGWLAIAQAYPATSDAPLSARRVRFGSLRIGSRLMSPNYGSSVDGRFTQTGFWLRPILPFRPFHAMIFVPWARVESVEQEQQTLGKAARIRLAGGTAELFLFGALGLAALDQQRET